MKKQIQNIIDIFSENMISKKSDKLNLILHNDVIFFSPDYANIFKGKNECINSINEYHKIADTFEFKIENSIIFEWNNTANIKLDYYIEYQIEDRIYKEKGTEFWTLAKEKDNCMLTSRVLLKIEKV
jgi:hypothetical protein